MAGNRKANKCDKIERLKRIRTVQELILQSHNSTDIIQNIMAKWNINERWAKNYISEAYVLFREQSEKDFENIKAFHIQSRLKILKRNLGTDDKLSLEILKDMAKIDGLYVEKVDHTSKGEKIETVDFSHLSFEQLFELRYGRKPENQ